QAALETMRNGKALPLKAAWNTVFQQDTLVLPGDFQFDFTLRVIPPTTVTIGAGDAKDIDLTVDKRAGIHVIPPTRAFPNSSCANASVFVSDSSGGVRKGWYQPPVTGDATYHVFPFTKDDGSTWRLLVNDVLMDLNLNPGQTLDV